MVLVSSRSLIQATAYGPKATFPASGSRHSPFLISVCTSASQASASFLVRNVSGAGRSSPSGPRYRAWYRPEGSLRTRPNCQRFPAIRQPPPDDLGQPVETADIVVPVALCEVVYEIPIRS